MKTKLLSLITAGIFALMLISFTSALTLSGNALTFNPSNEGSTKTLLISNSDSDGNFNLTIVDTTFSITDDSSNVAQFSVTGSNLLDTNQATLNIKLDSIDSDFDLGSFSETFTISAVNTSDSTLIDDMEVSITLSNDDYCKYDNLDNLEISIEDVRVISGFGEDEDFWYLGDEVEIEVEVSPGDYDIEDISVEWCLYDNENKECVMDDEESSFDLDHDDDEEVITISFTLDPSDFSDSEDYTFYVRATGEIADSDSSHDNENTCAGDEQSIPIHLDNNFVVLTGLKLNPENAQCGGELHVSGKVWNIGSKDQENVYVMVYNNYLNIRQEIQIGDIDSFDSEPLDFTITLPEDAEEKTYELYFEVYDEDDDIFQNDEDDNSESTILFDVEGSCEVLPQVLVTAELTSEAKEGKDLTIKAKVTNSGEELTTYNLLLDGYSEWADSAEMDLSTIALGAGASQEVLITLHVKKDVAGLQSLDLEVSSGDETVLTQPINVEVLESTGFFRWPSTGSVISGDNWYLWGIGALNVLLVIIIIIVAIRVARS